jgi:hypothetical protein
MQLAISSLGIPTGLAGWDILQKETPASFPAFMNDPVLKREIAYFEQNAPKATTAKALLANPQLQDFALTAYGLSSEEGMNGLMQKVLESAPGSTTSFAAQMVSSQYQAIATAFNYGGTVTPAVPAQASSAQVTLGDLGTGSDFSTYSGTFAGITLGNVSLTGVTTYQGLASSLQAAFRRADGNRSDISVTASGLNLVFSDDLGRGTATSFAWTTDPLNTGSGPAVSSPQDLVTGSVAQPAQGGPAVTNPAFIKQVVQAYTEAQFQAVVGNSSNTLRQALYAQQQLPNVTSWNAVIADRNLADVVQTVLGLPQSFGALNITQQNQVLSSRMSLSTFQNPTKLNKMLNQFVAISQAQSQSPSQTPAVQLMSGSSSSGNGIINLTLPNSGSQPDTYSSASAAAMLLSTATG